MGDGLTAAGIAAGEGLISSAVNVYRDAKNRDFQEEMSNTAHQRETKDLYAAGLNPLLSLKHGGASMPSSSVTPIQSSNSAKAYLEGKALTGQQALQRAQIEDINSAKKLKDVQAGDVLATQAQRINGLIMDVYSKIQSGNLSGKLLEKANQEISNLEAQRQQIMQQTTTSAAQLHKETVKGKLWSIPEKAINKAEEIRKETKKSGGVGNWIKSKIGNRLEKHYKDTMKKGGK